jgi:hypothetical protein
VSKQLGPIEVCCDAPSYWIVRACRDVGIRTPEDVRWLRASVFQYGKPGPVRGLASFVVDLFRTPVAQPGGRCTCGARVPELTASLVVIEGSETSALRVGQCSRCRTVFWDAQ